MDEKKLKYQQSQVAYIRLFPLAKWQHRVQ